MEKYIFVSGEGDEELYTNSLVFKPETKKGALEAPSFEDIRGKIERTDFRGVKFNTIETKKGFMRSGDLHKSNQFDLVLSGKIELWTLVNGKTEKTIITPNQYIVLKPHVPHLFNFLEDTVMIEWWDGPFSAWFYSPYRDVIDLQFKKSVQNLKKK